MPVNFVIDAYRFGSIVINGVEYNSDVIITSNNIISDWWRKESHLVTKEDLDMIDWGKVNSVFIGNGETSQMKVAKETIELLERRHIPFIIMRTPIAVREYNRFAHGNKLGIFHITC